MLYLNDPICAINSALEPFYRRSLLFGLCIPIVRQLEDGSEPGIKEVSSGIAVSMDDAYDVVLYHRISGDIEYSSEFGFSDGYSYEKTTPLVMVVYAKHFDIAERIETLLAKRSDFRLISMGYDFREIAAREWGAQAADKFNYETHHLMEIRYNLITRNTDCIC